MNEGEYLREGGEANAYVALVAEVSHHIFSYSSVFCIEQFVSTTPTMMFVSTYLVKVLNQLSHLVWGDI